jgi:MinD-like ATPase involved in chromosome partitioning or flagellar assembly
VLNDEFHSSYRIRDRQVIVVNRQVPGAHFTITVLKNIVTKEAKFLPASYVVNTWDAKTDALTSSEAHHQTWQRIGAYDLPKETLSVKATPGNANTSSNKAPVSNLQTRSLLLSNVHLLK